MENVGTNPKDIIQPQGYIESVASFLNKVGVTKDLIKRLLDSDTTVDFGDGNKIEITLDDVRAYIAREVEFNNTYYPPGFRYNLTVETGRKRASMMEKMLKAGNYEALIKLMLDTAVRKWNMADRLDAMANKMSPEEKAQAEETYRKNLDAEAEITRNEKETGVKQEHGIAPKFLEVGGDSDRRDSKTFLSYAVVLAKTVMKMGGS